jgi:hypothetical protein
MFPTSFYNVRHILYKFPVHLNYLSSYLSYIEHSPKKWSYSQEMFEKIFCALYLSLLSYHMFTQKKANEWVLFCFILVFNEFCMYLWYVQFYLLVFLSAKYVQAGPPCTSSAYIFLKIPIVVKSVINCLIPCPLYVFYILL